MSREFDVVILETGEIKRIVSYRTKTQAQGFKQKQFKDKILMEYEDLAGRNFSIFNQDALRQYFPIMNDKHFRVFGAVVVLSAYLQIDSTGKLPFATIQDVSRVLNIDRHYTSDILKKAEELSLLFKTEEGFYLNTDIINRGLNVSTSNGVKAFHRSIRTLTSSMSLNHIGFIALIMPYLSFDHWVLCHNPECAELENIKGMSIGELSQATGVSKAAISKKMKSMTFECNGYKMAVFSFFRNPVSGKQLIIVNPAILGRKASANWKNIINLFIISH